MATETVIKNPNNLSSDLNLTPPPSSDDLPSTEPPPPSSLSGEENLDVEEDVAGDADTDVQKKMKRAERFGMPVKLSEEEKRNSRAERFGTGSAAAAAIGSDSSKSTEDLKRKARGERFGIVQSDPANEESKKKTRLAKPGSSAKIDPVEEEKKKARALRFAQPDSSSKSNGKGDIEAKTAAAAKAGEET